MKYNGIVISGLPCSGKSTVGKRLAEKYNWQFYSVGNVWDEKFKEWMEKYSEGRISSEILFGQYWKERSEEENKEVDRKTRSLLEQGQIVVDSRYACMYCPDLPLLRVYIDADPWIRAQRCIDDGRYPGMSAREIKEEILKREAKEIEVGIHLFGYDYTDESLYHISLDSGKRTIEEQIASIDFHMREP